MNSGLKQMLLGALALAALAGAPAVMGADLGRLFFTPAQREDMERRRQTNVQEAAITVESVLTVGGHVSRSGGPATTWINGVAQADSRSGRDAAEVVIAPAEGEAQVKIKVGQTLDRTRGEVREGFGAGEVRVGAKPREAR